jgi:hypothetical protein
LDLRKLRYWAFESGLISINNKFCLLDSAVSEESGNKAFLLRGLQSQKTFLPKQKPFFPSLATIKQHLTKKFLQ